MSMSAKIAVWAGILYACTLVIAWLGQRWLMYFPDRSRASPRAVGLTGVEERTLATPDGEQLVVWRVMAQPGRPTLLYFHGNAGGLENRADRFQRYQALGFGIYAPAYRGYAGSTGSPSEAAIMRDARLAYRALIDEGVRPEDIVLYGESLGSGVAVDLAAEKPVGAVVLDAPYASIVEIAAGRYPFLPVRWLLTDRYESDRLIGRVKAPVLVLQGALDRVVPPASGAKLYALAHEPKRLIVYPQGRHSDLDQHGAVDDVRQWLAQVLGNG
jgi:fermentation-respiration switch protein FrsA (DUF1100 family)